MSYSLVGNLPELCSNDDDQESVPEDEQETTCQHQLVFRVENIKFTLYIGAGNQSLKWLSLIACEKYLSYVKMNARRRAAPSRTNTLQDGRFYPHTILLNGESTTRPYVLLKSLIGKSIEIFLAKDIPCSPHGIPELSPWINSAYLETTTNHSKNKRRSSIRTVDFFANTASTQLEPSFSPNAQPDVLEKEFDCAWNELEALRRTYFDVVHDGDFPLVEEEFREMLMKKFSSLCIVFEHYAWFGGGGRGEQIMTFGEILHCVHSTSILNLFNNEDHVAIVEYCAGVTVGECAEVPLQQLSTEFDRMKMEEWLFDRTQFVECLVRVIGTLYDYMDVNNKRL